MSRAKGKAGRPRTQLAAHGTAERAEAVFCRIKAMLATRVAAGAYESHPDLEQRLRDFDPIEELAVIATDPANKAPLRAYCLSEIAKYVHTQLRSVDVTVSGDPHRPLVIGIADWAAMQTPAVETSARPVPALPETDDAKQEQA